MHFSSFDFTGPRVICHHLYITLQMKASSLFRVRVYEFFVFFFFFLIATFKF